MDKIPPPPFVYLPPKEQIPVQGIIIYAVIVMVSILFLSIIYSFFNINFPIILVKASLPFAYALLLGYFMSWGIFLGKIKGMKNVIILALCGSIISVYFLWTIWTAKMLDESMFSRVGSLFLGIQKMDVQGVLIRGEIVGGTTMVRIIWILETIAIFLIPIFVINDKPSKLSSLFSNEK